MRKALSVIVVFLLLLSAAALTFGILLFQKREVLKGRTQKLERCLVDLGRQIEAAPVSENIPAKNFPARDVSPCNAETLESPQKSTFWDTYKIELEVQDIPKLDIEARRVELMNYYKRNFEGGIEKDEMGQPLTKGENTMQNVLDDAVTKATDQYNRLIDTRTQLKALRDEYIAAVEDLNKQKGILREKLVYIVQLETKIKELEEKVAQLEAKVAELEAEIKKLQGIIQEKDTEIAKLNEVISNKDAEIVRLKKEIDALRGEKRTGELVWTGRIEPGQKGKVIAVNGEWNFVVLQITDDFMKEILGQDLQGNVPPGVDLNIRHAAGGFVTKVRLASIRKNERMAVADVLLNWKQGQVSEGDVLYY